MPRLGVFCKDDFLFQKIKLSLLGEWECTRLASPRAKEGFELVLAECAPEQIKSGIISMGRGEGFDLKIPFTTEALSATLKRHSQPNSGLKLDTGSHLVIFKGKSVKLTELEFSLLSLLLSEARFFSKEEILKGVWTAGCAAGIVNVYIHYLREKLESEGERVIISSRGRGYKIDERFLSEKGGEACAHAD